MSEKSTRAGFVEDLASLFMFGEDADGLEALRGEFAEAGAEELARQFAQAESIVEGLMWITQELGVGAYVVMSDAKSRVMRARWIAENHAREESN
jgi:hypothetical protein